MRKRITNRLHGIFKPTTLEGVQQELAELDPIVLQRSELWDTLNSPGFAQFNQILTEISAEALQKNKYGEDEREREEGRLMLVLMDRLKDKVEERKRKFDKTLRLHNKLTQKKHELERSGTGTRSEEK